MPLCDHKDLVDIEKDVVLSENCNNYSVMPLNGWIQFMTCGMVNLEFQKMYSIIIFFSLMDFVLQIFFGLQNYQG